jgi:hypothetical protein
MDKKLFHTFYKTPNTSNNGKRLVPLNELFKEFEQW